MFFYKICESFRNKFFYRIPPVAARKFFCFIHADSCNFEQNITLAKVSSKFITLPFNSSVQHDLQPTLTFKCFSVTFNLTPNFEL